MEADVGAPQPTNPGRTRDPLRDVYFIAAVFYVVAIVTGVVGDGIDGHAYWALQWPHPYPTTYGVLSDGFNYSPVAAQILLPLLVLPWPVFHALLTTAGLASLYYLAGRWSLLLLLFPPVAVELWAANINLVLAVAIVAAFRYPGMWALPLMTKVASGIGVFWFALRREWRSFAIAIGVTTVLVAVSYTLEPEAWAEWVAYLRANVGMTPMPAAIPVPLLWRLPAAAAVLIVAALTNRRWLVPITCVLATPVVLPATLTLLLASWRLSDHRDLSAKFRRATETLTARRPWLE